MSAEPQSVQRLSESKVYPIPPVSKLYTFWYIILVSPATSLVVAIFDQDMRRVWINLSILAFFTLISILIGVVVWLILKNRRLIVGREGIIYINRGYTLYTPWANIDKAVSSPHNGEPALQLHAPPAFIPIEQGIREERAAIKTTSNHSLQITGRYDAHNYIPLPPYPSWRKSSLWQDIQQHIPEIKVAVLAQ